MGEMELGPGMKSCRCGYEGKILRNGRKRIGRNCFLDSDGSVHMTKLSILGNGEGKHGYKSLTKGK